MNNELVGKRPIVGIDLGTTNSSVAYINASGEPEIITSFKGEKLIPSVIMIDLNNQVVVGQEAKDAVIAMPERTMTAVKRKMGQKDELPIADRRLLPEEASAIILKELKKYADAAMGEGEKEAVITVPAYFTDEQRRATKQAGEIAGFVVERIINEPTAAALAYGLNNLKKKANILVYDLGGGTFDVSVVEMMKGILEVKSSAGDNFLGGEDFDWKLVDFLAEYMIKTYDVDPRASIQARYILKTEAEKIKILLSKKVVVEIAIPIVVVKDHKPLGIYTQITREQFEAMIAEFLDETMVLVKKALDDAQLDVSEIRDVLLVGGSTAIPKVEQLLKEYFNKKPKKEIHPEEAVALGAAVQAGIKSGQLLKQQLIATDVAPFAMGIAVLKVDATDRLKPGGFQKIIDRNTTIPVRKSEPFTTCCDGQTTVSIEVYQGEDEWVEHNHFLGEFLVDGIPPAPAGMEGINVSFFYNINGILEVTAELESTGKKVIVNMQDELQRDSMEVFRASVKKIEALLETKTAEHLSSHTQMSFIDAFDFEDEKDFGYPDLENQDLKVLKQELEQLRTDLSGRINVDENQILELIEAAITTQERSAMIEAIEEATDLLIKLDLD
ncbi:Hsp70 family protein [Acetobacterium wieringae]|uniref:Chaperone protein DnaK n=1 Tax=Acetobacterium wieringae TaxID=52694 RepID=A0ABY6HH37_9FIRM|nr:Hsp70 family protein [Acetobacterium wieringae]UYO63837.1 Hsp70 family protein [Acetobacterium wieringae]VUZ27268.1 Chaperone protein DnaK [Acetobacterium wieringae]